MKFLILGLLLSSIAHASPEEEAAAKIECEVVFKQIEIEKLKIRVPPHGESQEDYIQAIAVRETLISDYISDPRHLSDVELQAEVQRIMSRYNARPYPSDVLPGLVHQTNVKLVSQLIEDFEETIETPKIGKLHNFLNNVNTHTMNFKYLVEEHPNDFAEYYEEWSKEIFENALLGEFLRRLQKSHSLVP